jgi:two-component system, NarL family, response regulator DesR
MTSSRPSDGTPFVRQPPVSRPEKLHQGHKSPTTLLVVDDDVRVRAAVADTIALETDMVMVGDAGDADTALRMAAETNPSVVLLDVLLPDRETGLALVTSLAQRPNCAVVAMSGRGGMRASALAAGAVAFVDKAGDVDALLDVVRQASVASRD